MKYLTLLIIILLTSCKSVLPEINFPPPQKKDMTVGQNGLTEEDYWNLGGEILSIEDIIGNR